MRRLSALLLLLATSGVSADDWRFGGHAKYQFTYGAYHDDDLAAVYARRTPADHELDLRLKAEKRSGPWETVVHYELLSLYGDSLAARRTLAGLGYPVAGGVSGLPQDDRRLLDLTRDLSEGHQYASVQRLDRLSLAYLGEGGVLRAGRQAISWGNGLVFQPLDIFNPFSPIAIDKDYKTGDDMLYGQRAFGGKSDVQAILLPRRDPVSGKLADDQGSMALKYHSNLAGSDVDLLLARHYDEPLLGVGLVRNMGGAVLRMDLALSDTLADGRVGSVVVNADYSWVGLKRNMYGYLEYFHNGFGMRAADYAVPSPALSARLARGELFTLGRDYLAAGIQTEISPLVNVYNGLIVNLHDASGFYQLRGVYDYRQNLQLQAGINLPYGGRDSEYGGVAVVPGGPLAAPARSVYMRSAYYF
jgi:hypothetical protein